MEISTWGIVIDPGKHDQLKMYETLDDLMMKHGRPRMLVSEITDPHMPYVEDYTRTRRMVHIHCIATSGDVDGNRQRMLRKTKVVVVFPLSVYSAAWTTARVARRAGKEVHIIPP